MADSNVAQDQIKAFVDRILRMKEEAKAINADIREIYAEAKANGFDKTVLGKLVTYVEKRQTDAAAVMESESIFDLYLTAYDSAAGNVGTKRATHTHASEKPSALAALKADPSMHIVDVAHLKSKSEPQSAPQTGSDLTSPSQSSQGQVAPHPVAKADDDVNAGGVDSPSVSSDARSGKTVEAESVSRGGSARALPATSEVMDATAGETAPASETDKSVEASASAAPASKYAAPGEITWETHPPEGVERSPISIAFANMGQDAVLIRDEMERGRAQPIVKQGKVILDGWCRFMTARDMTEMDGSPLAYAVVQYAGDDPLIDIIKLNVEGRMLTDDQKRLIAKNLTRLQPNRKADIYKAFELWMEPV